MKTAMAGTVGALWGLAGVFVLIGSAVYRLTPRALEAADYPFSWYHWSTLSLLLLFMAYAEGYRGFQRGFSPRVAARAKYLRDHPSAARVLLAPFFCMGYFHTTRRRQITSLSLTAGIVLLIITVHFVPQPWRGIIDAGVVVGLAWGLVSLLVFSLRVFLAERFDFSPEVSNGEGDR